MTGRSHGSRTAPSRRFDIDNLRALAVLLLIPFHTARLFDAEEWHIKDMHPWLPADLLIRLLNQWHMPLLFLLAGASAYFALQHRGAARFARERLKRLGVPLLFGMLVVVPPQVYVERISHGLPGRSSPIDFSGSLLDFYPHIFACCYPQANLSWHHLWFVAYLLVLSLAALPVFLWLRSEAGSGRLQSVVAWLSRGPRLFLLAVPLIVVELALRARFPSTHDLVTDWANLAHYFLLVVAGFALFADARLIAAIARLHRAALALGVLFTLAWFAWRIGAPPSGAAARAMLRVLWTAGEWFWLLSLLGLGACFLDRRLPFLTWFSGLAYPFYVFHQTVIVLAGWFLLPWPAPPLLKFCIVAVAATAASLALSRAAELTPLSRFCLGLRARPRAPTLSVDAPSVAAG